MPNMTENMEILISELKNSFPIVESRTVKPGQGFIVIEQKDIVGIISALKTVQGFTHLAFLTAVDMIEDGFFYLVYMLRNHETKTDLGVKAAVPRDGAEAGSIHHLWKQAATYQRELYEMFGISFPGSPGMKDPFILEGWDNVPPMRREFDTKKYSEETFFPRPGRTSNDPTRHMEETIYPEHPRKEK